MPQQQPPPRPTYEPGESVLAVRVMMFSGGGRSKVKRFFVFRFEAVGPNLSAKWVRREALGLEEQDLIGKRTIGYKSYEEAIDACRELCRQRGMRFGAAIKEGGEVRTKAVVLAEAIREIGI